MTTTPTREQIATARLADAADTRDWVMRELREAVVEGYRLGLTKMEIHQMSGVSRVTINKWLSESL